MESLVRQLPDGEKSRSTLGAYDAFWSAPRIIRLDFYINDVLLSDEFLVVPGLSEEAIIGAATLQKWRIKLDFERDQVIVDPKAGKLQLI